MLINVGHTIPGHQHLQCFFVMTRWMHEVQLKTDAQLRELWWKVTHQLKASIKQYDIAGLWQGPVVHDRSQAREGVPPVLDIFQWHGTGR